MRADWMDEDAEIMPRPLGVLAFLLGAAATAGAIYRWLQQW